MSFSVDFDMKDYFGNCGMSVTGYDIYEIETIINDDWATYSEQYKKEHPEPTESDYSHPSTDPYGASCGMVDIDYSSFDRDHDAWESDASMEMYNYFEAKIGDEWIDVLESNYHPAEFLAEYFGIDEEAVINVVGDKQLTPEDLDSIVDDGNFYCEPDEAIDHIRSAIAKL